MLLPCPYTPALLPSSVQARSSGCCPPVPGACPRTSRMPVCDSCPAPSREGKLSFYFYIQPKHPKNTAPIPCNSLGAWGRHEPCCGLLLTETRHQSISTSLSVG